MLGGAKLRGPGFEYDKYWFQGPNITNDPTLILQKAATLRELRYIIPTFVRQEDVPALESPVDQSKFNRLSIIYAGHHTKQLGIWTGGLMIYNMDSKSKDAAEAHVVKTGKNTKYEDHWVNDLGYYTRSSSFEV